MFKKSYTGAEIKFVMFDNDELVLSASVTEGVDTEECSVEEVRIPSVGWPEVT